MNLYGHLLYLDLSLNLKDTSHLAQQTYFHQSHKNTFAKTEHILFKSHVFPTSDGLHMTTSGESPHRHRHNPRLHIQPIPPSN
jgi:hypothetical protein